MSRGFAPARLRVYQTLYRARRMVMSELEWALQQDLDPQERRLFQGLHAAAAEEVQDLRAYLDAEGALHTMAARSGHGPRPAARAQEVVTD